MNRIYFRNDFKLYIAHFTPNRQDKCALWTFHIITKEYKYIGYYDGESFEKTKEWLPWDVERSIDKFLFYLKKPFYKRSIPGVVRFKFA